MSAGEGAAQQRTIFEADAFAALDRAKGHAYAFRGELEQAVAFLEAGAHPNASDVRKGLELFRLVTVRVDGLHRRIGEGWS